LRDAAPGLDGELLARCVASLEPGARLGERVRAWQGFRRAMAPFARRPRATDVWLQVARRLMGRGRRVLGRPRRKRPSGGGRVVALVGSDGSGKTTVATGLEALLSPVFATARIHLGKPRRSWSWLAVRAWLHLGRRLGLTAAAQGAATEPDAGETTKGASGSRLLIGVLTARDRRRAALRAHRLAANGVIVLCDRYPLPQLEVDGPRTPVGARGLLARIERRLHAQIPGPDVVVVLQVPPEVAKARRPEADPALIESRAREILDASWGSDVAVIDAERPRDEVLADAAAHLWASL
jgi:thymidylate kinase